jgi:hypothetical protein
VDKFKRGHGVLVVGLEAASAVYNGMRGKVLASPHDDDADETEKESRVTVTVELPKGGSKEISVWPRNLVRPCNLDACTQPAQYVCGRCQLRVYCSAVCRNEDWVAHKAYCEAPFTHAAHTKEQLRTWYALDGKFSGKGRDLSMLDDVDLPAFPTMWGRFQKAQPPGDPVKFQNFVVDYCLEQLDSPVASHQKLIENFGAVRLTDPSTHAQMKALPWAGPHDGRTPGAAISVSFSCVGIDKDTGELVFMLVCVDLVTGYQRFTCIQNGKPTKHDFEKAIFHGCSRPVPMYGYEKHPVVACLPSILLVAFRWGEEVSAYIKARCDALGIDAVFETYEAAERSAAKHGTDPMGMNFVKESTKDNSLSGTIKTESASNTKKGGKKGRRKK